MVKKIGIIIGIMLVALSLGFGIYHSSASNLEPELSMDEIKQLVSDQYPGTITKLELEKNSNKAIYEVEITGNNHVYELHLDGKTGEVVDLREKMKLDRDHAGQTTDADEDKPEEANQPKNPNNNEKEASDADTAQDNKQTGNKHIQRKQAVIQSKKAMEIALNEFAGEITDFDLEEDDGRLIYEIEIENGDREAEIKIDAYTGEIYSLSIENDD
ncbi:PepSY domain-containing protein [Lentibacillus sp. N15]|uniref:PepSY domain-containing protein n=1 Tax=Lentibacillus songyuanensis TaxID=3136161 RepID=UPI0031BB72C7